MFLVQGLIYDNNASHDLSSFTVDCANGCDDKCVVGTASKRNLSSPRLYSLPPLRRIARIGSRERTAK